MVNRDQRKPNVVLMLDHRLRRFPNSETTLDQRLVFAVRLVQSRIQKGAQGTQTPP